MRANSISDELFSILKPLRSQLQLSAIPSLCSAANGQILVPGNTFCRIKCPTCCLSGSARSCGVQAPFRACRESPSLDVASFLCPCLPASVNLCLCRSNPAPSSEVQGLAHVTAAGDDTPGVQGGPSAAAGSSFGRVQRKRVQQVPL